VLSCGHNVIVEPIVRDG